MRPRDTPLQDKFEEYALSEKEKISIGEIILIGADVDQCVSIALFKTAEIHADVGFSLFGRTAIGTKIKQLRMLLKAANCKKYEEFQKIEKGLDQFLEKRNMFAHGLFMGKAKGVVCFLVTAEPALEDEEEAIFKVRSIRHDEFRTCVFLGEQLIVNFKQIFDISTLQKAIPYTLVQRKSHGR